MHDLSNVPKVFESIEVYKCPGSECSAGNYYCSDSYYDLRAFHREGVFLLDCSVYKHEE